MSSSPQHTSPIKCQFPNKDFPVLAFLYAVVIGGEHETYCDHTVDYVKAYLIGAFNDPEFAGPRNKLIAVLANLDAQNPERRRDIRVVPNDHQWDIICQVLAAELKRGPVPNPVW